VPDDNTALAQYFESELDAVAKLAPYVSIPGHSLGANPLRAYLGSLLFGVALHFAADRNENDISDYESSRIASLMVT
jgi:hypothetical protein